VDKPVGIVISDTLTFLGVLGLGFIYLLIGVVFSVGMGPGMPPLGIDTLVYYMPLYLALSGLALFILNSRVSHKFMYYAFLAYWFIALAWFIDYFFFQTSIGSMIFTIESGDYFSISVVRMLILPTPFLLYTGCIAYYIISKKPKEHYHLRQERQATETV
jgi:hypothetical protein